MKYPTVRLVFDRKKVASDKKKVKEAYRLKDT